MQQAALNGTQIFRPLGFQMDQRPLPTAEGEVLDAGELEEVLLGIGYPMCVTVMPAGREALSTVTV